MADEFALSLLKISLAQLGQNVGFHSGTNVTLSVLLDIYHRYLETMCRTLRRYSDHGGRTEPVLEDAELMFRELRVPVRELSDYVNQVAPVPFRHKVSMFPVARPHKLKIPPPDADELRTRPDYIPDYLPLMKPEPTPTSEQQVVNGVLEDDKMADAGKINAGRVNVHRTTISSAGKQNLSQCGDLIGDFSDFDAVKAGLVKFVRIPTPPPPPPPRVPTPLAVPYPLAMSPVSSISAVPSSAAAISPPNITVAEEISSKKKQPTILDFRPDAPKLTPSLISPHTKLKISLPSMAAYKKRRVMPLIVHKKEKNLKISSPLVQTLKEGEEKPKRRGRPPGSGKALGRPPGTGKVGRPPKKPVVHVEPITETEKKADVSTDSVVADVLASVSLDTSSSIEELVTSVIEETRNKIKAQGTSDKHVIDSVNSVISAQSEISPTRPPKDDDMNILAGSGDIPEPVLAHPKPTAPSVQPEVSSQGPSTSVVDETAASPSRSKDLKKILNQTRRVFNKDVFMQMLKDKSARKQEEEKKIRDVVKSFPPIAKREESVTPAPEPIAVSSSSSSDNSAKPPRRPPGIPPTSTIVSKPKSDKPPIRQHIFKPDAEKILAKKPDVLFPPLFQPDHITKSVPAQAASDNRKVAPLVISTKTKPPADKPRIQAPPAATKEDPKRHESTKLIIKLPHKPAAPVLPSGDKERKKRHHEKEREKEKQSQKHRVRHVFSTIAENQKKLKVDQPQESPLSTSTKKTDPVGGVTAAAGGGGTLKVPKLTDPVGGVTTAAGGTLKVPKLKINIGKPKSSPLASEKSPKMKGSQVDTTVTSGAASSIPLVTSSTTGYDTMSGQFVTSPPPKSPSAHSKSPSHAGSVGGIGGGGYESPPPRTPSPGNSCPPSPTPLPPPPYDAVHGDQKSKREIISPPAKKQRIEPWLEAQPSTSEPVKRFEIAGPPVTTPNTQQTGDSAWYCPVCNVPYMEGGPDMIACDSCDKWFHWACVGLMQAPPADENWYCQQCQMQRALASSKRSSSVSGTGGQKRKQKPSMIKKRYK